MAERPEMDNYVVSRSASLGATSPSGYASAAAAWGGYFEAFEEAASLVQEMVIAGDIDPPDQALWQQAVWAVMPYTLRIEKPLVYPLQLGGVSVEWHDEGLDIEVRFRADSVFTVIKDARGEVPWFLDCDPDLAWARKALNALAARTSR